MGDNFFGLSSVGCRSDFVKFTYIDIVFFCGQRDNVWTGESIIWWNNYVAFVRCQTEAVSKMVITCQMNSQNWNEPRIWLFWLIDLIVYEKY